MLQSTAWPDPPDLPGSSGALPGPPPGMGGDPGPDPRGTRIWTIRPGDGTVRAVRFDGERAADGTHTPAADADLLRFVGPGLTAASMRLTANGADTEITFDGVPDTRVVLEDFRYDRLDNVAHGAMNVLFAGQTRPIDAFDTVSPDQTLNRVWNRNSVTFLDGRDDTVAGWNLSDDVINGQGGDDVLRGLAGDDILRGGSGADRLTGDAGADVFVFSRGDGRDTVTDFQAGADRIDLAGLGLNSLAELQDTARIAIADSIATFDFGHGDRLTVHGLARLRDGHFIFM